MRKKVKTIISAGEMNRPTSNMELMDRLVGYKCDGVVSKDQLPKSLGRGHSLVINLDDNDGPGTHWVALCNYDHAEYFDSFGLPPPDSVMKFMKKLNKKKFGCFYNTSQIQPINSQKCGLYCVKYIIDRANGHDPYEIINSFSRIIDPLEVRPDESISF